MFVLVLLFSFTTVNVFAGEIDRAKQEEIEFAKAVVNSDSDLNIDAKAVSDDELKSIGEESLIGIVKDIKKINKKISSNDSTIKNVIYVTGKSIKIITQLGAMFTGWGAIIICLDTVREAIVAAAED